MSDYVIKAVRLPRDLAEEIIAIAKEEDSTFSGVVRHALDSHIQGQCEKLWPSRTNKDNFPLSEVEIQSLLDRVDDETPDDEQPPIIIKSA